MDVIIDNIVNYITIIITTNMYNIYIIFIYECQDGRAV